MYNYVDVFLMRSVLGRNVKPADSISVVKGCISKAYDDMLTAGRFYPIGQKESNCEKIYTYFKTNKFCYSEELIKQVKEIFGKEKIDNSRSYATAFGLAQKVVNMTFKYFYCFWEFTGLDIDFTLCDCPIDSVVLDDMAKEKLLSDKRSSYVWSKLTPSQYKDLQSALNSTTFDVPDGWPPCSPRLCYDFHAW